MYCVTLQSEETVPLLNALMCISVNFFRFTICCLSLLYNVIQPHFVQGSLATCLVSDSFLLLVGFGFFYSCWDIIMENVLNDLHCVRAESDISSLALIALILVILFEI